MGQNLFGSWKASTRTGVFGVLFLGIVGFIGFDNDLHGLSESAATGKTRGALSFWENQGQADSRVRFYTSGSGFGFYFTTEEAILNLARGRKGDALTLRLRFREANPDVKLEGRREMKAKAHFYLGKDPAKWRTGVSTYRDVVYRDLWKGVEGVFRGEDGKLKYEFVIEPRASVEVIRLAYVGAEGLSIDEFGNLRIEMAHRTIIDERPTSYQVIDGVRVVIESRYEIDTDVEGGYHIEIVGDYDPDSPLVIDPGIEYTTYLGGNSTDQCTAVAVDSAGNAYITGLTLSTLDFPGTASGSVFGDAFVTVLAPDGSLVWTAIVGGSNFDQALDIVVNSAGSPTIVGQTSSGNFPATPGALDTTLGDGGDAFVAQLSSDGSNLIYATYLGGDLGFDSGTGIAMDDTGNIYATGWTTGDFPTTTGAFDVTFGGVRDAFVSKLNSTGSALIYSTYLGGVSDENGTVRIGVDAAGNAYVAGYTSSADFPTTVGAFDVTFNGGGQDAFMSKLNATGTAPLVYSTYLGGSGIDQALDIAVDGVGNAYVVGFTSSEFPTTPLALQTAKPGGLDGFVTHLDPGGSLIYSTYLGGAGFDFARGIAINDAGDAFVTGQTGSGDFPMVNVTDDSLGGTDAFLARLDASGGSLGFSTYLGGSALGGGDNGAGVAVDADGSAIVVGHTGAADLALTTGAADTTIAGIEGLVAKFSFNGGVVAQIDIKPDSATNSIHLGSAGVIPVAILSSASFDATTVDPATVSLAGSTVKMVGKSGRLLASEEDVNGDGLVDLLVHVETDALILELGETIAILEAQTFGGESISGEDIVRIVPN
ncbi:MAG: SBBP repeat-containing protein [Planctomycetota bacterium]|nr:SBBP repeat-containing protein [Planctomycetota bacterium]